MYRDAHCSRHEISLLSNALERNVVTHVSKHRSTKLLYMLWCARSQSEAKRSKVSDKRQAVVRDKEIDRSIDPVRFRTMRLCQSR